MSEQATPQDVLDFMAQETYDPMDNELRVFVFPVRDRYSFYSIMRGGITLEYGEGSIEDVHQSVAKYESKQ